MEGDFLTIKLGTEHPVIWKGDAGEDHSYEALSYVLTGDDVDMARKYEKFVPLLLPDYKILPITEALRKALVTMRYPKSSRLFWTDQLCISQNHPRKVAMQVPIMHRIFGGAKSVICWLGASSRALIRAMDLAVELDILAADEAAKRARYDLTHGQGDPSKSDVAGTGRTVSDSGYTDNKFKGFFERMSLEVDSLAAKEILEEFMKRTWFGRAWTYQEAMVCKHTIVQLASQTATLEAFQDILTTVYAVLGQIEVWYTNHAFQSKVYEAVNTLSDLLDRREAL